MLYHKGLVSVATLGYFSPSQQTIVFHLMLSLCRTPHCSGNGSPGWSQVLLQLLLLELFSVFYTHAHSVVHAALYCPESKDTPQITHTNKSQTKNPRPNKTPHTFLQLHVSRFCFVPFTSVFFSPLHFVLLMLWKSMRQNLFCQEFLNPLKILTPLFLLPWQSFPP